MRIGVALTLFPPVTGGAELLLLELARRWVSRGHQVTVFTRAQSGAPTFETMAGIAVRRTIRTVDVGPLFGLSFISTLAWDLVRQRRQFDVVLAFQAPWESAATASLKRFGVPLAVTLQQSGPFGDLARLDQSRFRKLLWNRLKIHDQFVGLSEHACRELVAREIDAGRCHVIHNGIDHQRFSPARDLSSEQAAQRARTALFVGRLTAQKNPMLLLRAWQQANLPNHRLKIVGAGELEAELREFVARQQLANVEFLGKRTDMPDVFRSASVFVLPSLGEGCCMALLEAMASGCAPIATNVGGNVDVITHEQTGLLCPSEDVTALADAIRRMMTDSTFAQRLAQSARASIETNYNIDDVADKYLELFQSMTTDTR